MADASPIIELIPSTGKEDGWKRFLDAREQFLKHPLPTRHELMRLHELVTPKAGFSEVPVNGRAEFMAELIIADRPDWEKKHRQLTERLARAPYQGGMSMKCTRMSVSRSLISAKQIPLLMSKKHLTEPYGS
ncbi:hypothetical protein HYS47_03920 [Candidatus Woesearchaeota archaeon]|nr:hypothetical protein [Candidatus Woesearchaeota archaeon]